MYAFLRRPKWIAFTLGVLLLVVVMVNLGLWQLRRLDERQERNAAVRDRATQDAVPIEQADGGEWQNVQATGEYDANGQVLVRNRSLNGSPGYHVLTPLVLSTGEGARRQPRLHRFGDEQRRSPGPRAPDGHGHRRRSRPRIADAGAASGPAIRLRAPSPHWPGPTSRGSSNRSPIHCFRSMWSSSRRRRLRRGGPTPIPLPHLDNGPHLSYAIQWFTFATLAVIGWVVVVRKSGRDHKHSAHDKPNVSGLDTGVGLDNDAP